MEPINEMEIKLMLGEKDILIAQLVKTIQKLEAQVKALSPQDEKP